MTSGTNSVDATSVSWPHSRRPGSRSCPRLGVAESRSFTAHTTRNTTMRLPYSSSWARRRTGRRGPSGRARRTGRGARCGDPLHGSPPGRTHSSYLGQFRRFVSIFTVWALRRRPRNLIDRWDGTTFRRVIVIEGRPTELAVRQAGSSAAPRLFVSATPPPRTPLGTRHARSVLDQLLGLRIDLNDWYHTAAGDTRLRPLADTFRGMKPPRFPTMFEALVNAIVCQQLSLDVGLQLLNRLGMLCSERVGTLDDARYAFPSPHDVARLPPERYRAIGFSHQKARALLGLARAIVRRELDLESLAGDDVAVVRQRLLELGGVGRWTSE